MARHLFFVISPTSSGCLKLAAMASSSCAVVGVACPYLFKAHCPPPAASLSSSIDAASGGPVALGSGVNLEGGSHQSDWKSLKSCNPRKKTSQYSNNQFLGNGGSRNRNPFSFSTQTQNPSKIINTNAVLGSLNPKESEATESTSSETESSAQAREMHLDKSSNFQNELEVDDNLKKEKGEDEEIGNENQGDEEDEGDDLIDRKRITNFDFPSGPRVKIKSAVFVKSSSKVEQCPKDGRPEFAVIGRSNVGKSSLINMVVGRKDLAQTSKRPGKTQLINHFLINDDWYLVDLPGYGFAKAPKATRTEWNEFTKGYFLKRKTLVTVFLLVDASIPPMEIDSECTDWLARNKIPTTIVFTKCDRKKKKKNGGRPVHENVREFLKGLSEIYEDSPPWIMTSAVNKMGKDELIAHIVYLKRFWNS